MSADFSVFSLSHESIECFCSGVLFKFTSWKEGGEAVAPHTHCQLYHASLETARSCFGVFVLYMAPEGCLHSHYPVVFSPFVGSQDEPIAKVRMELGESSGGTATA